MTDGSSQGLFVIVAVVIFGIFVLISYILFRDNLKPSLAKIYCDSFTQVSENTGLGNGLCSVDVENPDENSIFKFDSNTGTILGFKENYTHTSNKLIIPDKINGVNVKIIGDRAFVGL